jgi:hypothetical protein
MIRLFREQLHALNTRLDEHAMTKSELVRRDALCDHPVAIHTAATTRVDAPYKLIGYFVHAPQCERIHKRSNGRRLTIDLDFVAQTADKATDFDGDSFSRSFRMDSPLMPKTAYLNSGSATSSRFCHLKRAHSSLNWLCRRQASS